ncbi:MAG: putative lipid II flippase FtsW [Verrucomicrobiota bacterium]|nr:putative lipid II flippase FtsW [Limisphaera sp.]MDW8381695.1 putative lipid II flippase FtsW [Verrucomicrobiota bacterium]
MRGVALTLMFCVAALLALGLVMLYSSSMSQAGPHFLLRQCCWCAAGLVLCGTLAAVDYLHWRQWVWWLYGLTLVLLVLVLVPGLGIRVNGARRWLGVGDVRIQPSELAKLGVILLVAWFADRHGRSLTTLRGLVRPTSCAALLVGLVFLEPDVGTALLLGGLAVALMVVAGAPLRWIVPGAFCAAAAIGWFVWQDPVRARRVLAWWDLEETKLESGFQTYQAMLALGSGGWTGLGLGNGRQKLGFVPEHHTDFIFAIIGEELGLVGSLAVVAGFVTVVFCGLRIALRARETFGMILAMGVTLWLGMQAAVNMAVVTSLLPNKGLPLPFISYGGSSLLAALAGVGLLLSVARRAPAVAASRRKAVRRNPFLLEEESAPSP